MIAHLSQAKSRRLGWLNAASILFALACCASAPGWSQNWTGGNGNNWFDGSNWSPNTSPNSGSAVVNILNATSNPVQLNSGATVGTLTLGTGASLDINAGLSVAGGSISNAGTITQSGYLELTNAMSLTGAGTLTLTGGLIGTNGSYQALNNQSTIQGYGVIGSNSTYTDPYLNLTNNGIIDANTSGQTLSIQTSGPVTNNSVLEATNGGILNLNVDNGTSNPILNGSGSIVASGTGSTVNLTNTQIQGGTLTTSGGGVMQTVGTSYLNGSSAQGAITLSDGSIYTAGAGTSTQISGTLNLGTTTGSTLALSGALELVGATTLSGPGGMVNMTGGEIGTNSSFQVLNNYVTIQGSGTIGSNDVYTDPYLTLNNYATIDANTSGQTLNILTDGTVTNNSVLEATNGGTLNLNLDGGLNNPILNGGGSITAGAGSTVNVTNSAIDGGTLTTSGSGVMQTVDTAYLNGSTSQGAITLTNGTTYTAGADTLTYVAGTLNLGTTTGSTLALSGAVQLVGATTLSGTGGMVNMTGGEIGTNGSFQVLSNYVTIQGSGTIGSNDVYTAPYLTLTNYATIDANTNGQTLNILTDGTVTNNSVLEATNGGILNLNVDGGLNNPILNGGGSITAGAGSTVNVTNSAIDGGTLTTSGNGVMQTVVTAYLNGGSGQGAITLSNGSTYTAGAGTQTFINGTLNLGTTTGSTLALSGVLQLVGATTLSGTGGVVNMTGGEIGTNGSFQVLNNYVTIQGSGTIGSNDVYTDPYLTLNNYATIDANTNGQTLNILTDGAVTNNSVLEATNGGTLNLNLDGGINNPILNGGGSITAGTGSTVNITNSAIDGGTLTTSGSGVMQTVGTAYLNGGTTQGAITISDHSTYTAGADTLTYVNGKLNLGSSTGGTLALSGNLQLVGQTTLSGPGSVTLSGGQIGTNGSFQTLVNDSTIQGYGVIGANSGPLDPYLYVSNVGKIVANVTGQTLEITGLGNLTNSGILQANTGSTLKVTTNLTNFSGNTLTGGTYNANGGLIQLNLGSNTGGEIVNDAATIVLSGPAASIEDSNGHNAMSNFSTIATTGSLAVLNGQVFTTNTSLLTNSGTLTVGANGSEVNVDDGSYTQTSTGTLDEDIAGVNTGQFGVTDVFGTITLDSGSTLDVSFVDGFSLAANTSYGLVIMDPASISGAFTNVICPVNDTCNVTYNNELGEVILDINGPRSVSTPEGGEYGMLLACFASLAAAIKLGSRRRVVSA